MTELLTIEEASDALRSGQVTSIDLTESSLSRIEAVDERVGAFIAVNDSARIQAQRADVELTAKMDRGPLHGIPFGLKDILATSDQPTTANSLVLDTAWGNGYDSVVTERVRNAGAIIMGKLVMSEFAIGTPDSEKPFPIPRNPWDLERSPAGSSSGTGIAISTGMVLGGIGTDTGGSVRSPASWNGHTGLKVTFGRVPKWGCVPLGYSLDSIGPMARSAWDCGAILNVIAGYDSRDITASREPTVDYLDGIKDGISGLRIGIPVPYFFDHPEVAIDQRVAVEKVIQQLEALGANARQVELPHSDIAKEANTITMLSEAFAYHHPDMGSARWSEYGRNTRMTIGSASLFAASDYVQAQRFRSWYTREAAKLMNEVDVLVTPTHPTTAALSAEMGDPLRRPKQPSFTGPFNLLGYPALALPAGFSSSGLPFSAQIIGAPFSEALLLRAGYAYQQTTDWHLRVPPIVTAGENNADN